MELTFDEGRVYGALYYTVQPKFDGVPYELSWYRLEWQEIENWCAVNFGDHPKDGMWTPGSRWYINNGKFWFRNKKDLEWFILRWS
jgi:hypothetical protein